MAIKLMLRSGGGLGCVQRACKEGKWLCAETLPALCGMEIQHAAEVALVHRIPTPHACTIMIGMHATGLLALGQVLLLGPVLEPGDNLVVESLCVELV